MERPQPREDPLRLVQAALHGFAGQRRAAGENVVRDSGEDPRRQRPARLRERLCAPQVQDRLPGGKRRTRSRKRGHQPLLLADVPDRVVGTLGHRLPRGQDGLQCRSNGAVAEQREILQHRAPAPSDGTRRRSAEHVVERGAHQAVATRQPVIEEGERPIGRERREPQGEPRELHRHRVQVDAVQASLGDRPAKASPIPLVDVRGEAAAGSDERSGVFGGKEAAGGHEERATSHRGIQHPQREDLLGSGVRHERRQRAAHEVGSQRRAAYRSWLWPSSFLRRGRVLPRVPRSGRRGALPRASSRARSRRRPPVVRRRDPGRRCVPVPRDAAWSRGRAPTAWRRSRPRPPLRPVVSRSERRGAH